MMADANSDPDRINEDVEKTRAELGATVQALAAKTDVKARGRDSALQIKSRLRGRVTGAAQAMRGKTAGAVQKARQGADSAGLTRMAGTARQRGNAVRQRGTRTMAAFRSSSQNAAQKAGPAARSIRDATVALRSAARRHRAAVVIAAVTAVGVATAVRQLRPDRRVVARRRR
ncbi:DUF3618 domain-containing protein [Micromonospora sp. NPDC007271]|uniref:DUF3618 domain-containing protein n=1 Tax=Micromonospora sp. NPDC007271 TaxID=3154587 RepID=UPI0033C908DC